MPKWLCKLALKCDGILHRLLPRKRYSKWLRNRCGISKNTFQRQTQVARASLCLDTHVYIHVLRHNHLSCCNVHPKVVGWSRKTRPRKVDRWIGTFMGTGFK